MRSENQNQEKGQSTGCRKGAVVSVESSKFIVALGKKAKEEYNSKIVEYATSHQWTKVEPRTPRRRRDEKDPTDDVFFFRTGPALQEKSACE